MHLTGLFHELDTSAHMALVSDQGLCSFALGLLASICVVSGLCGLLCSSRNVHSQGQACLGLLSLAFGFSLQRTLVSALSTLGEKAEITLSSDESIQSSI